MVEAKLPRVLITGAGGLLGAHLVEAFRESADVCALDRNPWWGDRPINLRQGDLSDDAFLQDVLSAHRPQIVVHCAAMVDVDACERNPEEAYRVNAFVTRSLARRLDRETLFVYVSTDSLFNGDQPFRTERDLPCPRTVYARSKLHGEWEVQLATANHLIVRTNLYGWSARRKKTFAEWLYDSLASCAAVTLFEDAYFTPMYVADLAERIVHLTRGGYRGIVNVGGGERISKCAFGLLMADLAGFPTTAVTVGRLRDSGLAADRPSEMTLDSTLAATLTAKSLPTAREGLTRFLDARGRKLSERLFSGSHFPQGR
jgi:dTDP-4-dehydrorhamnose reductase